MVAKWSKLSSGYYFLGVGAMEVRIKISRFAESVIGDLPSYI
jgi:hypothetical protein